MIFRRSRAAFLAASILSIPVALSPVMVTPAMVPPVIATVFFETWKPVLPLTKPAMSSDSSVPERSS